MKKLLMIPLLGIISLSLNISGPKYRLEMGLGGKVAVDSTFSNEGNEKATEPNGTKVTYYYGGESKGFIEFSSDWKLKINEKCDINFGPRIKLLNISHIAKNIFFFLGITAGAGFEFNYNIRENVKFYTGIDGLIGMGTFMNLNNSSSKDTESKKISVIYDFIPESNVTVGTKINDKYNVGLFVDILQGYFGLKAGYTF
ncbi:hypothetical protein [Streptobacillus moniliformis]|uniref:hypothetical protein n=1 Tax=Streptobacillus moniliformis TaxID=34105 RepID=UPI0007E43241|nr:hypothetical protein [Streptobacillus moniliformis]